MDNPAAIRDQASRRVRRITAYAIAGATALTAAFAGVAAGSTHGKSSTGAATTTATRNKTVTAPTPSLTPSGSTVTPSPAQTQPQPQVTPSAQPPVAVTGGS